MNNPICIDAIRVPGGGRIGMTACPGRWRSFGAMAVEAGDVENDLASLRNWGAQILVSLVELEELELMGVNGLGELAAAAGLVWYHCPIADFHAPESEFEACWNRFGDTVRETLRADQDVVIHCLAGLGRTGTLAARLLVEFGVSPQAAVQRVRAARPGAIQNRRQELYIVERRWLDASDDTPMPA